MILDEGDCRCALERKCVALGAPCLVTVERDLVHVPEFRVVTEGKYDQLPQLRRCDPD